MASPGKPIPYKDWRGITPWSSSLGKGFEHLPRHYFDMGWAVEAVYNAAYPYNRDYSVYDAMMLIPGTPGGDMVREKGWEAFKKDWMGRNGLDKPATELSDAQKMALSRTTGVKGDKEKGGPKGYFGKYWDEYHNDHYEHPEVTVFGAEWSGNNMAQSRRDFRCHYAAETVKRGIGLYFDNAFPHASRDPLTSDAYEIPGLGMQPSANLWEQRDYHRRIWNIHREFGARWNNRPMSMIHMTNTNVITMLTWNDMNVDLEWFYGPEPQQSKYGLPLLQAESSGRQTGCISYALAVIMKCKNAAERRIAERTKFGAMMVHDIRINFSEGAEIGRLARLLFGSGYGADKGETIYNYWDDKYPAACDQPLVKSLLVKNGGDLMLLICSWDKDPVTANFTLDTKALGIVPANAADAEGSAEEQLTERRKEISTLQEQLAKNGVEFDKVKKAIEAKPQDNNLKNQSTRMEDERKKLEDNVKGSEELLPVIEASAKLPFSYNSNIGRLSVALDGYGVRMIKLKGKDSK